MAPKKRKDSKSRAAADRARAKWEQENSRKAKEAATAGVNAGRSMSGRSPSVTSGGLASKLPSPAQPGGLLHRFGVGHRKPFVDQAVNGDGKFLADMFRDIQANQGGGAFSRLGGLTGGIGVGASSRAGAAAAQTAIQSVTSLLEQIRNGLPGMPQAPGGINPALVDVNATLAPFGAARDNIQAQAEKNRGSIATLAAQGLEDNADVNAAEQQRLASMEKLLQTRQAQNMSGVNADGSSATTDLAATGVDPALMASMQAQVAQQRQDVGNASQGALDMVASQKSTEDIEAKRNDRAVQAGQTDASGQLDAALFQAIAGINAQEQQARTQAEQFNAQAQQQANEAAFSGQQQQYEAAMARMKDIMGLPGAVGAAAAESGALAFPKRDQVMQTIMSGMNTSSPDGVGFGMVQALQAADNPDDAFQSVTNHILDINARRKKNKANPIAPDMGNIRRLIQDYYAQDGSLTNDGFEQLKRAFLG